MNALKERKTALRAKYMNPFHLEFFANISTISIITLWSQDNIQINIVRGTIVPGYQVFKLGCLVTNLAT